MYTYMCVSTHVYIYITTNILTAKKIKSQLKQMITNSQSGPIN